MGIKEQLQQQIEEFDQTGASVAGLGLHILNICEENDIDPKSLGIDDKRKKQWVKMHVKKWVDKHIQEGEISEFDIRMFILSPLKEMGISIEDSGMQADIETLRKSIKKETEYVVNSTPEFLISTPTEGAEVFPEEDLAGVDQMYDIRLGELETGGKKLEAPSYSLNPNLKHNYFNHYKKLINSDEVLVCKAKQGWYKAMVINSFNAFEQCVNAEAIGNFTSITWYSLPKNKLYTPEGMGIFQVDGAALDEELRAYLSNKLDFINNTNLDQLNLQKYLTGNNLKKFVQKCFEVFDLDKDSVLCSFRKDSLPNGEQDFLENINLEQFLLNDFEQPDAVMVQTGNGFEALRVLINVPVNSESTETHKYVSLDLWDAIPDTKSNRHKLKQVLIECGIPMEEMKKENEPWLLWLKESLRGKDLKNFIRDYFETFCLDREKVVCDFRNNIFYEEGKGHQKNTSLEKFLTSHKFESPQLVLVGAGKDREDLALIVEVPRSYPGLKRYKNAALDLYDVVEDTEENRQKLKELLNKYNIPVQ